jgi:hypothetical protein
VVGSFTLNATAALRPTTAGRTLDVTATGEAGIDWANVGSPTTTLALTGTTIAATQKVDVETIKTQTVTAAAGVTVLASVGTAATSTAQTGDAFARLGAPAGLSISADIAAVKTQTAAIETDTGTDIPATLSTIAGYIDTEVASILAAVDTEVGAIKAKTDSLTFTTAGLVDANIQQINDVTITGNGQTGTEFGV